MALKSLSLPARMSSAVLVYYKLITLNKLADSRLSNQHPQPLNILCCRPPWWACPHLILSFQAGASFGTLLLRRWSNYVTVEISTYRDLYVIGS